MLAVVYDFIHVTSTLIFIFIKYCSLNKNRVDWSFKVNYELFLIHLLLVGAIVHEYVIDLGFINVNVVWLVIVGQGLMLVGCVVCLKLVLNAMYCLQLHYH